MIFCCRHTAVCDDSIGKKIFFVGRVCENYLSTNQHPFLRNKHFMLAPQAKQASSNASCINPLVFIFSQHMFICIAFTNQTQLFGENTLFLEEGFSLPHNLSQMNGSRSMRHRCFYCCSSFRTNCCSS